jgi:hypothetical protein
MRWIDGVPQALPLETAAAINDAGQIAGTQGNRATLVTDDSLVLPLMRISGATVTEGNSGTINANFTVTLNRPSTQAVTIHYATSNGTATAGGDYTATSGTLTFTPGQTSKTISVQVIGDRIPEFLDSGEPHEFTVTLSSPVNTIVVGAAATGAIKDDEPRLSGGGNTVLEGHAGSKNAVITLSLSNAYDQPVTLTYATADDTAIAGSDYVATSGTLTFAPGETTKQIVISVKGDRTPESYVIFGGSLYDTEFVVLDVSNLSANASTEGIGGLGIQDDEPTVNITRYVGAPEPVIGTLDAVFTISLSIAYDQDVVVQYATAAEEGTNVAVAGADYVATAGSLRIPAGETSTTIAVPVIGDGMTEGTEFFSINLTSVSGHAAIDGGLGTGMIYDFPAQSIKQWIGPASGGNWSTAANWRPSGVPTALDHAAIAGKSVTLAGNATVYGLTLADGATLTLASNGSRVMRISTLQVSASSKLNLNDNDLIIDYYADPEYPWSPGGDIAAMLAAGRSAAPAGIYSPQANASGGLTTLAIAEASTVLGLAYDETGSFAGQTVDATALLIKYTYAGDANLDGAINIDDYGRIDANVATPGASGWFNGDFNYDGKINIDDYGIIDGNINQQGPPLLSADAVAAALPALPPSEDRLVNAMAALPWGRPSSLTTWGAVAGDEAATSQHRVGS